MKRTVFTRPLAEKDISEQALYIARDNAQAAIRFLDAARATFELLLKTPYIGIGKFEHSPHLEHLRIFPVKGFPNYAIFYRPISDGIEIIRVLHARRDLDRIMKQK